MGFDLALFRMGFFGASHEWGKRVNSPTLPPPPPHPPHPKICHTHASLMKIGTVIPYLKKTQKFMNLLMHPLCSADIRILSPEIGKFCYIKKHRYRLHFDT